jgi:hypothetical protein
VLTNITRRKKGIVAVWSCFVFMFRRYYRYRLARKHLPRDENSVDRHCTVTVVGLIKSWERRVGLLVSSQFLKTI